MSDGVPIPTLTWYKPDGSQINSVRAIQNTVDVKMCVDQDFGDYKCNAHNGLAADSEMVKIQQISRSFCLNFYMMYFVSSFSFFLPRLSITRQLLSSKLN